MDPPVIGFTVPYFPPHDPHLITSLAPQKGRYIDS